MEEVIELLKEFIFNRGCYTISEKGMSVGHNNLFFVFIDKIFLTLGSFIRDYMPESENLIKDKDYFILVDKEKKGVYIVLIGLSYEYWSKHNTDGDNLSLILNKDTHEVLKNKE